MLGSWLGFFMGGWLKRDAVIDGRRIAARERGPRDAPTVVLLHGLGAHQRSWDRVAKPLEDCRVITFDYAGHGRSNPADRYSVDGFLSDLQSIIVEMNVNDGYVLVGHSIGADLALLHASNAAKCRGVVLVDGALTVSPPETDWERFSIMENRFFFKALLSMGRRLGVAPSMSVQDIRVLTDDLERRRPQFAELLKSLRVPALYVIGDRADKIPDGQLIHERKMSSISEIESRYDVRIEYLPCGHFVLMRQPKRLAELVHQFSTAVLS